MNINFNSNAVNSAIIFDVNGNYGYGNNQFTIEGANYNGAVAIPNGVTKVKMSYLSALNKMVTMPDSVTNCSSAFQSCDSLNQNIQVPNSVTDVSRMFAFCNSLNQNIQIPNGLTNIANMFLGCRSLNQNIKIPDGVNRIDSLFNNCVSLNQNIQIPASVKFAAAAFYNCGNLNQNILVPNSVTSASYMFGLCNNLSDITIGQGVTDTFAYQRAFRSNASKSLNIHTDPVTSSTLRSTFLISSMLSFQEIENGHYNSQYNLYIYNNVYV